MEFDLIARHFKQPFEALSRSSAQVELGIGDDCASLVPTKNSRILISTDTLNAGVHYFESVEPSDLGWKVLACSVSDLAAVGAKPLGFTLSISIRRVDEAWFSAFSQGLLEAAQQWLCPLVGGDTTSVKEVPRMKVDTTGESACPLFSATVTVFGQADCQSSVPWRSGAKFAQLIGVTGTPGLARVGLLYQAQHFNQLSTVVCESECATVREHLQSLPDSVRIAALAAFNRPRPPLEFVLGTSPSSFGAAIDLSDGLSGDLEHLAIASGVQFELQHSQLADMWKGSFPDLRDATPATLNWLVAQTITGGDDFQLCFTADVSARQQLNMIAAQTETKLFEIGHTVPINPSVMAHCVVLREDGVSQPLVSRSWKHF